MKNIVEILKDCPKGTKLYSPIFGEVELDEVNSSIFVRHASNKALLAFYEDGKWHSNGECMLFPSKENRDWDKFCPFKDGDVVVCTENEEITQMFILKSQTEKTRGYCYTGYSFIFNEFFDADKWYFDRLATKEEKQKLFDAIKANGYKWNAETKTLEKLVKLKFKIGDRVKKNKDYISGIVTDIFDDSFKVTYDGGGCSYVQFHYQDDWELVPNKFNITSLGLAEEENKDTGEVSDGYHTFNELYEYRLLYNASMFNELAKQGLYDVHKSKRHSDGEIPFSDSNWFIVMAELPTGQISNHYPMKDWDLFQIPEKEKANKWDGHTPKDVAERIRKFLTPKPKYPTTYEECCEVLKCDPWFEMNTCYHGPELCALYKLLMCRDAYWKIAGEEIGLGKSWEPDWSTYVHKFCIGTDKGKIRKECVTTGNRILAFPTEEMRDVFYENFKDLIESCKELL